MMMDLEHDDNSPLAELAGKRKAENIFTQYIQPCVAEFIGTMFFVFIGTCSTQPMGPMGMIFHIPLGVAFAHGFTIFILVAGFGHISGGHFNPAVSLGVCLAGELGIIKTILWVISQLVGGILGAASCRGAMNADWYNMTKGGSTLLNPDISVGQGFFIEFMLTALLVTTVLMTAVDSNGKNVLAPLAIGSSVVMCALAGGFYTGASMNPARSLGPAIVATYFDYNHKIWTYHYVYWIGPAVGATFAALMYRLFLSTPNKNLIAKRIN